jgi:hypothetical protein
VTEAVRFERSVSIDAPRLQVFAELSDPARFLGLQPLLRSVREVGGADGTRCFEAIERVPLVAGLTMPSRLRVELRPDANASSVAFRTQAPLGIRLAGAFDLRDANGGTEVTDRVELHCARLLRSFVAPQAIRAQEALLANLKRRLEGN